MTEPDNTNLHIPFNCLEDHIQCSICLSPIRGAVLTPCGHRYCYKCIAEWIGREHSCPCCKKDLQANTFYYDVQFDSLVEQVLLERDKAEQSYFDKMFNQVIKVDEHETSISPFQEILRRHLKKSMVSTEQYFYNVRQQMQHKITRLQSGIIPTDMKDTCENPEEAIAILNSRLEESEKIAAQSLDRFLSSNIPSLNFLPVIVSVYISDKQIRLENISCKPTEKMIDLRAKITESMKEKQEIITSWCEDGGQILLVGPLAKMKEYDMKSLMMCVMDADKPDVTLISWDTTPVLQHYMLPGSEIVLHKTFKVQADEPLQCYAHTFTLSSPQPVDYFTCEDCASTKWICKSCVQGCHKGHKVTTFVLNHTPSWGCCYCPKKRLCKIKQNG